MANTLAGFGKARHGASALSLLARYWFPSFPAELLLGTVEFEIPWVDELYDFGQKKRSVRCQCQVCGGSLSVGRFTNGLQSNINGEVALLCKTNSLAMHEYRQIIRQ